VRSHHARADVEGAGSTRAVFPGASGLAFVASLSALAILLIAAPAAMAAYSVDRFIGGPDGSDAGRFSIPSGPAVSAGGDVYVADQFNHRIQQFDSDGTFVRAWGTGVAGGGFDPEICEAADLPCRKGRAGSAEGAFDRPRHIAVSPVNDHVYVVTAENARIDEFDAAGHFVRTWGWGVDDGTAAFQICTSGCEAGAFGSGVGQLGSGGSPITGGGIAVSPVDGDVFVADPANRRVLRFNANGTLDAEPAIGSAVSFAAGQPAVVAVDSRGILYASDQEDQGEVDRYDAYGVHSGGTPGALTSIATVANGGPLLNGDSVTATNGLAVRIGASPSEDRLYVARDPATGSTVIQQLDDPGQVAPPSADAGPWLGGFFGQASLLSVARGLAYNTAADRLYVTSIEGEAGHGVFVFDADGTGTAIDAEAQSPTGVTATGATLRGALDPAAGLVAYRFEYTPDGEEWISTPEESVSGSGEVQVTETVTGLVPHSSYRVRLVVTKVLAPDDVRSVVSDEVLFTTEVAPPTVETRPVHQYDDTSAWLVADVNPNNQSTTYHFEWGTTSAYGNSVPVAAESAGSGGASVTVLERLDGLSPATTYHYRVVAGNGTGTIEGADRTFTTRLAFAGFASRDYEQVSPASKLNDIGVADGFQLPAPPVSADGKAVIFETAGSLGGSDWGQGIEPNVGLARRDADSWDSQSIKPESNGSSGSGILVRGASEPSFDRHLLSSINPLLGGVPSGYYMRDLSADSFEVMVETNNFSGNDLSWASEDLAHVAFVEQKVLTSDPGVPGTSVHKVYEWVNGEIRLASIKPDGTPFTVTSRVGGGTAASGSVRDAVSADGEHLFFSAPHSGNPLDETEIYRRDHGMDTVLVSPSRRTSPDPLGPQAKVFLAATPDQSESGPAAVFFASEEKLTDQPTSTNPEASGLGDLYRYEVNADTLVNLSAETNDPNGAEVLGILGSSDDGKWVYYAALGQVVPGEGVAGRRNVYLWHDDGTADGSTRPIATLADASCSAAPETPGSVVTGPAFQIGDGCNWQAGESGLGTSRSARVSTDGQTLLFQSTAPVTGYDNDGFNQVYLYEVDANGAGQVVCVSCNPNGSPSQAHALLPTTSLRAGAIAGDLTRTLSADGKRVFFTTAESLTTADTNGALDVYVWEAGRLSLVSPGDEPYDSYFYGASADGDAALFRTRQGLVGQDVDGGLFDVYDARVGGGLASQNQPPPGLPCVGEACKPPPPPLPPAPPSGGSATFTGPGNLPQARRKRCAKGRRKARRAGKTRCVKPKRRASRKTTKRHR
jgi:hypothetical protein